MASVAGAGQYRPEAITQNCKAPTTATATIIRRRVHRSRGSRRAWESSGSRRISIGRWHWSEQPLWVPLVVLDQCSEWPDRSTGRVRPLGPGVPFYLMVDTLHFHPVRNTNDSLEFERFKQ